MRKLAVLLSLLLVVVVFYGCASAPPQPEPTPTPEPTPKPKPSGFTIDARTHKAAYNIGEEVIVSIRADKTCYVSLFNLSPDGTITRIFPNGLATNNYIQGQQIYHVPSQTDRFRLKVSGPQGTEQIRVIATLQNVNIVGPRTLSNETFPKFNGTPEEFEQALDQQLSALPASDWADATITFQVQ